jgi:hypothetical protein
MKICRTCKIPKDPKEFPPNKYRADGIDNQCLDCHHLPKDKRVKQRGGPKPAPKAGKVKGKVKAYVAIKGADKPLPRPIKRRPLIKAELESRAEADARDLYKPIVIGNPNKLPGDCRFKEYTGSLAACSNEFKATYGTFPRTVYQFKDRYFMQQPPAVEHELKKQEFVDRTKLKKVRVK